jgi:hypothetical protein
MKLLASLVLLLAALTARAAEWDRYQVILDRHPFGTLTVANTNITPDFAKSLRLSAIWMAHGQPRAGFEDTAERIKRDFVIGRGEVSEDGLELVDVNISEEAAVIRKGNETATLHIQSGASTNLPVVGAPGMAGMPPGAGAANPWREFYERYRQRHQQEGGGGAPPAFPMPPGGPGGATFSIAPGSGAAGQPIVIQMQAAPTTPAAAARAAKYSAQSDANGKGNASDAKRSSHKHSRAVQ